MSVNVLQQRTATQGYDIMGGGTPQPEEAEMDLFPTDGSPNPVTSNGIYDALETKQDTLTFDSAPTDDSTNPVTSGGVYTALESKQDTLTFDNVPTNGSSNPVKSDGIYDALAGKSGLKTIDVLINPTNSYFTIDNKCYVKISYILTQCTSANIDVTKPLFIAILPATAPIIYSYLIMNLSTSESQAPYFEVGAKGVIYGSGSSAAFNGTNIGIVGGATGSSSAAGVPYSLNIAGFTN